MFFVDAVYTQCYYSPHPTCTNNGSKRVILSKNVSFGCVNKVSLNFGGQTPKKLKF